MAIGSRELQLRQMREANAVGKVKAPKINKSKLVQAIKAVPAKKPKRKK